MSGDFSYLSPFFLTDNFFLKCYHPGMVERTNQLPLNFGNENSEVLSNTERTDEDTIIEAGSIIYPVRIKISSRGIVFLDGKFGFEVKKSFICRLVTSSGEIGSRKGKVRIYKSREPIILVWNKSAKEKKRLDGEYNKELGSYFIFQPTSREAITDEKDEVRAGNGKQ